MYLSKCSIKCFICLWKRIVGARIRTYATWSEWGHTACKTLLPEANMSQILTCGHRKSQFLASIYQVLVAPRASGLVNMTLVRPIFMYFSCHPWKFHHRHHIRVHNYYATVLMGSKILFCLFISDFSLKSINGGLSFGSIL